MYFCKVKKLEPILETLILQVVYIYVRYVGLGCITALIPQYFRKSRWFSSQSSVKQMTILAAVILSVMPMMVQ